ncbi:MAG: T9SS type A sorting domain-containing protein, partial [Bacteroidales bacterium]
SFTISGRALEDQVNIAEPVAFEISLTGGAAFIAEPGLNLPQQGGTLTPTQVFVRMKAGLAVGDYNENILITSPGTEQKTLTLSGNVIEGINPPQAHVTQFTAIAEAFDKIRTEWTDAQPEAEAYLIKASKDGFEAITPPVNGIEEINSDMVRNLPAGTETCSFTELEQLTEYFFKIYPYNGNGEHITYKTDGQVPQASATTLTGPSMTTEILPLYFGANNNRLTYAFRMAFNGLHPNATYKYINQVVSDNDGPTVAGAGVPIFVQADGSFNRSSSTSFSNPDQHGLFTTDNNGEFAGWFMIEPTTNVRFAPGNTVYMRIRLNDGQDGNNPVWYFTSEGVQMIGFGTEAGPESGTGIRGTSKFMSGNFVMLYGADNRPLAGTHIEVSGIDFAAINSYAAFYRNEVNGIAGAWGTIVPNDNPTGVIRIEERSRESGEAISVLTNPTGLWDQTNTVNPRGGLTNILVIETDQEPELTLEPHQLTGFQYVFEEGPSLTQSFTISGRALEDQVNIAEPVAFEISLTDGAAFIAEPGLNLPQQGGTLTPTQVFVRMKAGLAVGDYNESILITSPGTEQKTLALSGNVIEAIYTPEAYPTNFTAEVNSKTKLTVSWTDALPAAEGYVVKASSIGFNDIQAPIDGQIETESQSVKLAAAGIQTVAFTGLQQATTYYFQIFPFNGSGDRIRYKTDGTVPKAFAATLGDAMLTDLILPQFIQGVNGTNNTRLPFAFRVKLSNLIPNAIYRYTNQAVSNTDTPSAAGAGNPIYVSGNTFFRTTNPGFVNEGQYGVFSTNASGEYTGWFMIEPTGNIRFTPGNTIQMRIRLNDGNNGTTAATYLTTGDITVLNFGETNTPEAGTAIRATSSATPKNFALIYNNITGSGRPLYGTSIEVTDIDFAANTTYPAFYRNEVAGQIGAWGGIVPNMNQAGVRRIEERSLLNGNTIKVHTSENGIWDYTFTSNPTGGLNEVIVLNLSEEGDKSSLSGQLKIFNPAETSVQSPTPQTVFYVQLFENGTAVRPRQIVSSNQALQLESYFSFVNLEPGRNYTLRVWESNQYNNLSLSWLWNNWGGATSVDALLINHMSVMSPLVNSFPWLLGADGTSLSDFAFHVADVNGNGSINASDALSLMNRIIGMPDSDPFAGNKHNFHIAGSLVEDHHSLRYPAAPDIQFEAAGNYQPSTPLNEIYYEAVLPELQAGTNVFNIYFSPVGDVNASFAPQHNKQSHRKPGVYAEKIVQEGDTILLPLFLSEAAKLSACNISFSYDPQQIEVKAIYGAPLYYHNAETHMITMGWLEYEPFYLAHDIPIAHIEAVIHQLPDDGIVLSVNSDNTSFASPEAIELSHLTLKTFALRKAANADLHAFAFPNPFTEHTTIQVQLPEGGTLSLLVFDELGRMVYSKTTEASSGTHQLIIDSNSLTGSAVYHYTVMLNGRAKQYYLKGKLIRVQ